MITTGSPRRWPRARFVGLAAALALGAVAVPVRAAAPSAGGSTARLYAGPAGSGSSCSSADPCSLTAAQRRARAAIDGTDVEVVLEDGTYPLAAPLTFTAADSGRNRHRVVYRSAPGAHPVLSGGLPVTGWSLHDAATGVWSAQVPAGTRSRELYVNGQRAVRATGSLPGVWTQTHDGYTTTDRSIASWRNPSSIELIFSEGNGFWTEPRCDVASVTPTTSGTTVNVRQPCWSNLHIPDTPSDPQSTTDADDNAMGGFEGLTAVSNPSSIENAYELLDTPGEWYLDEPAHTVFYMPRSGEDLNHASVVMPVLQDLVEGNGTLAAPVHDLELRGLSFAYTTWLQPSSDDGFAEMQSNVTLRGENASGTVAGSTHPPQGTCQYSDPPGTCPFAAWTKSPASVTFHAARNVTIAGNSFSHLGSAAVNFDDGSKGNLVQGNEITDTSGSGIQLGDTTDPQPSFVGAGAEEINENNTIADNWIHDIAAEYHGGVGIWVGYTRGSLIAHNQIARTPYSAISFGWGGWHTDTLHPDNPSIVGNNTIADNLIYDYLLTLPDGGAIYTNGTQGPADPAGPASNPFLTVSTSPEQMARGLTIRGNVALLATWSEFAYYNDEGADYVTWDHNVEYQAHAFATGGCNTVGHILIHDNYWAQPLGGYICPPPPVDVNVVDHHILADHPGPGDIPDDILTNAGLEPAYRSLVTAQRPEVTGVGPQQAVTAAGGAVLVSGSGFTPGTQVFFGAPSPATRARSVKVLSANYLEAVPPSTTGQVDIVVRTPAGTSVPNARDQFTGV